ncbi:MAG TPA: D-alanyl-D-alanine carboxypeptidase family protein [Patescibacteria group bacterium]
MHKFWLRYLTAICLFLVCISLILWLVYPLFDKTRRLSASPLPSFLTLTANAQVTTLDIWLPIKNLFANNASFADSLSAKSAVSYDLTSNQTLFSKNANTRLPMASLTKIMTAIIALENRKNPDEYVVSSSDLVGEDSMGLTPGESLSLEDLLYGLILHSGNDAAEVLADNYPAGRSAFIDAMNAKAQALGLTNTHFTNPTGLEGDGKQYTTAYDLLVLTKYAIDNFPLFKQVVATFEYDIPSSDTHKEYYLENETNLLTSYPGVKGVKTGYTPEAGLCLVTYLEFGNQKIIGVVLGSGDRRDDMKDLLDYSLKKEGIKPPKHG